MTLRQGVPTLAELDTLLSSDTFAAHHTFNTAFIQKHAAELRRYGRWWGRDPLSLWSRRWEYPFAASHILRHFDGATPSRPIRLLDAGSGVTYLPFYLCDCNTNLRITCCDANRAYVDPVRRIAAAEGAAVDCIAGTLEGIPAASGSFDVVACLSVLEHTADPLRVAHELVRVLVPGGLLVLTFDLSLDGKFRLLPAEAAALMTELQRHCDLAIDPGIVFGAARDDDALLSTDHFRRHAPQYLPFTHPRLLAAYDLLRGYGRTGGFRSATVVCLAATLK